MTFLRVILLLCIASLAEAEVESAGRDDATLRIASWNLAWLGSEPHNQRTDRDYQTLSRYSQELDADIIALQEVESAYWARKVFGENYVYRFSRRDATQRVGFAIRKSLAVPFHVQEYKDLDVGNLRYGLDLTLEHPAGSLRLLAVHLKAGCQKEPLSNKAVTAMPTQSKKQRYRQRACAKLSQQIKPLEQWIDERAVEQQAYLVLGDFNRQFVVDIQRRLNEQAGLWQAIDDTGAEALWSPTLGRNSRCWGGRHRHFIDHIVLGAKAKSLYIDDSFRQVLYQEPYQRQRAQQLSDHCPISVDIQLPLLSRT